MKNAAVGADSPRLLAWSMLYDRCAACWCNERESLHLFGMGLQTHHIIRRSRVRCDRTANLLRLCPQCHDLAEGVTIRIDGETLPLLPEGVCLWLKFLEYPAEWNPRLLAGLIEPRPLDDLLPIPDWFIRQRERRQPYVDWRDLAVPLASEAVPA